MIEDWINYTINKYNNRNYEKEEYLTEDFASDVLNKIEKTIIQNLKINQNNEIKIKNFKLPFST